MKDSAIVAPKGRVLFDSGLSSFKPSVASYITAAFSTSKETVYLIVALWK